MPMTPSGLQMDDTSISKRLELDEHEVSHPSIACQEQKAVYSKAALCQLCRAGFGSLILDNATQQGNRVAVQHVLAAA